MSQVLKNVALILGGILVLLVVIIGGLHFVGQSRLNNAPDVPAVALTIPTDPAALAHGEDLAQVSSCVDCHGADLSGTVFIDEAPIGYIPAPESHERRRGHRRELFTRRLGSRHSPWRWGRWARPGGHAVQPLCPLWG